MKLSGKDLTYFDEASKTQYTPILIESSAGMDRTTLTMLIDAYENETTVDPATAKRPSASCCASIRSIAPVQVGGLFARAQQAGPGRARADASSARLRPFFRTQYDEGNVGQLYRRQDEIGTPFCIMVDYDTLDDGPVTVRDRDTMRQDRVAEDRLAGYLADRLGLP